jgi:hypothetical protein
MTTEGLRNVLITARVPLKPVKLKDLDTPFHFSHILHRYGFFFRHDSPAKAIHIVLRPLSIEYIRADANAKKAHRRRGNLGIRIFRTLLLHVPLPQGHATIGGD